MSYVEIFAWMMVFIRAGGMLALMPVFSGQMVPMQVRIALAAFLAFMAMAFQPVSAGPLPAEVPGLVFISVHELFIGLLMGLAVRLIFYALEFAGQLIATEIGLVMSAQIDPISRNNSTVIGTAFYYFGALLFLISGAHHAVFAAFLRSFSVSPVGGFGAGRDVSELFVHSTGNIFLVAVQMAAPIMAVNFIITFTFAILGKAAPSMNVFSESFAVRILAGIALLGLTLGLTAQLLLSTIRQSPELMLRMIP